MQVNRIYAYTNTIKKNPSLKENRETQYCNAQSFCAAKSNTKQKNVIPKKILPSLFHIKTKTRKEKEEQIFLQFAKKGGKVSKKEFLHIKGKYPFIIDKAFERVIEDSYAYTTPTDMAKFALNTKNYLDNCDRLKNKKYCIISIGTSPAPLTEALNNLGCDVIFFPISGVRFANENENGTNKVKSNANLRLSLEYTKEKCEELKTDKDTQFVILDYAFSRKTLNTISELVCEDDYITSKDNVWAISLSELMDLVYKSDEVPVKIKTTPENLEQFLTEYDDDLYCSDFTPICNVPHFYLADERNKIALGSVFSEGKEKKDIFKEFDEYSRPLGRCYSLCVLTLLKSMGGIK